MSSSKKIPTQGQSGGIFNPFEVLSKEGLPEGQSLPEVAKPQVDSKKGRVVLRRETAQRGGKTVVVVSDFATHLHDIEIENWAKDLKKYCGCGGAVKDREIIIQGDQPARVAEWLTQKGFRVAGVTK